MLIKINTELGCNIRIVILLKEMCLFLYIIQISYDFCDIMLHVLLRMSCAELFISHIRYCHSPTYVSEFAFIMEII